MSDFGQPVAQNVNVNPMQNLSQILSIKGQMQGLKGQAAQVQQEQQTASQRAGIASFMQHFDPTEHIGADGTLDVNAILADPSLRQKAGDAYPEVIKQMIGVKQAQLAAKQQLVNLNDATRTQFQTQLGGLRTDPDVVAGNEAGHQKVQQAIGQFAATGEDAARIASVYGPVFSKSPNLVQTISNAQLQAQDASAQAARQAPQLVNQGDKLTNIAPQSAGGDLAGTQSLGVGAPPGYVMDPVTHSYVLAPPVHGAGGHAPAGAPAAPGTRPGGLPHYAPGEADTIAANTQAGDKRYNELVSASAESPARINVLDNIIRLAPKVTTSAVGGWKAAAETALGQVPGFKGAADDADAYNQLIKYMHQSAIRSWQAAGGTGTDAQLSHIEGANPNKSQGGQTIAELAKFNKAGELALQAKASAHNAWMHQPGNNFANQADFENEWRQHFDPIAFQLKTWSAAEATKRVNALSQSQKDKLASEQAWLKDKGVY